MYKPLPDGLTINISAIHELGLFTKKYILKGTNLGISHLKINNMLVRTPLGGFVNHSDNPNCMKIKSTISNIDDPDIKFDYIKYNLITLEHIKENTELTLKYTFYNIK